LALVICAADSINSTSVFSLDSLLRPCSYSLARTPAAQLTGAAMGWPSTVLGLAPILVDLSDRSTATEW
uniref:Uncharacterized protein n=1 Tax=Aegilops tauschii subsp. strangulata TaxID=200361 RepID=A0A453NYS0_AEGTS